MRMEIHYLVRQKDASDGLVYPSELKEESHYGFGSFYLMGAEDDEPAQEYAFHAIFGEELITATAVRLRDEKFFFSVEIKKVGRFIFYAQAMPRKYPYGGQVQLLQGKFAFRRMRSWKPAALDTACREHGFYFVGSSPMNKSEESVDLK